MTRRISGRLALARSDGLLVEEIGAESVVYDTESKQAHCLSPLAAAVFAHCDGRTGVEALAELAGSRIGEPVGVAHVEEALVQLDERGLLAAPPGRMSRRTLVRKTAVATAAITAAPLVTSIVTPAYAQVVVSPGPSCPRDLCSSQGKGDDFCNTVGVPEEDSCECEDCSALEDLGIPCPDEEDCPDEECCESDPCMECGGCEPGKKLDGLCVLVKGDT